MLEVTFVELSARSSRPSRARAARGQKVQSDQSLSSQYLSTKERQVVRFLLQSLLSTYHTVYHKEFITLEDWRLCFDAFDGFSFPEKGREIQTKQSA